MDFLNILHLSDFHIGNFRYENAATLAIKVADTLDERGKKVDIVLITGDIFDGRSTTIAEDKTKALDFFNTLVKQLVLKEISISSFDHNCILFVPGNHDLQRDKLDHYEKYDSFINEFYLSGDSNKIIRVDKYNFICDFPEKKIAILGFNSCKIQIDKIKDAELKWIDKLSFSKNSKQESEIKKIIRDYKITETKWDDYGYIDPIEMDNVFNTVKKEIPLYSDYNLVACFHHHFYPFPEIVNKYPDSSFIRNYTDVIDKFQRFKVQLVLHGHKHLSIQRAITDNKYFENPESIIYVLSAGSVGCKDVYNPSFQWMRVFNKNYSQLVDGEKYDFKDEELDNIKNIILPPQIKEERSITIDLIDMLWVGETSLYQEYKSITDDFEQALQDSDTKKIIKVVSILMTSFGDIKLNLTKNPKLIYIILLSINYRVIFTQNSHNSTPDLLELIERLKSRIISLLDNTTYAINLIKFLSSNTNKELDINYLLIINKVRESQKRISAYCSISLFLTDLFLNISKYGEYYFDREKLNHKINVKLPKDDFYKNIPSDSISIESDIERRAIIIDFKCKDPTVHKVAVLIIKDFEMRLNKFEESLKEIKLKLYYISPIVRPYKYDLENFHFDAYIPTLLPLLTGDNLYKQKEVFIRELVQNAIDATLLRKKLVPDTPFNTDINIEMGIENTGRISRKYFKITDNGIGMSKFTIERYFTSIGRSFYVSEEFDKIKTDNKISYNAISNFGIGFLSSFMVCREILVKTKNIIEDDGTNGLEIEIPNYEGCFFIRKIDLDSYGTEIILYEDHRQHFKFHEFIDYIKLTFVGIPLNLIVTLKGDSTEVFKIESYDSQRKSLYNLQKLHKPVFYIPFSEDKKTTSNISWSELTNSSIDTLSKFGIEFDFSEPFSKRLPMVTNQGLKISEPFVPKEIQLANYFGIIKINYPSSFIQLDVARDKVISFKDGVELSRIKDLLIDQVYEFLITPSEIRNSTTIFKINFIYSFLKQELKVNNTSNIQSETYCLKIDRVQHELHLSIVKISSIPKVYDMRSTFYWFLNESFFENVYIFFYEKRKKYVIKKEKLVSLTYKIHTTLDFNKGFSIAKDYYNYYREMSEFSHFRLVRDILEVVQKLRAIPQRQNIEIKNRFTDDVAMLERRENIEMQEFKDHTIEPKSFLNTKDSYLDAYNNLFLASLIENTRTSSSDNMLQACLLVSIYNLKYLIFNRETLKTHNEFKFIINVEALLDDIINDNLFFKI